MVQLGRQVQITHIYILHINDMYLYTHALLYMPPEKVIFEEIQKKNVPTGYNWLQNWV